MATPAHFNGAIPSLPLKDSSLYGRQLQGGKEKYCPVCSGHLVREMVSGAFDVAFSARRVHSVEAIGHLVRWSVSLPGSLEIDSMFPASFRPNPAVTIVFLMSGGSVKKGGVGSYGVLLTKVQFPPGRKMRRDVVCVGRQLKWLAGCSWCR